MEPSYSFDDLVTLAAEIADPTERPRYLKRGERPHSKVDDGRANSIFEAFESGRPFCIKIDERIVVIDDDDGVGFDEFVDEYLRAHLPLLTRSGPAEQRGHLLVAVELPEEREAIAQAARAWKYSKVSTGGWLRPPGAPHTEGGRSELVGLSVAEARDRLSLPRTSGLKLKGRRALYDGMESGLFNSPSEVLLSATLGLVNLGWDDEAIFIALLENPGGESLRSRIADRGWSRDQARRWWIKYTLGKARSQAALSPVVRDTSDVDTYVRGIESWIEGRPWKGIGATNAVAGLRVILGFARRHRRLHAIGISTRQLAEEAGLGSCSTASRCLKRLIDLGVLEWVPQSKLPVDHSVGPGPKANRYSLAVPPLTDDDRARWMDAITHSSLLEQSGPWGCVTATVPVTSDIDLLRHDAFRREGLGKQALRVWEHLSGIPVTGAALARTLKLGAPTVRGYLHRLAEVDLAVRVEKGWIQSQCDLDDIAKAQGTAGVGARQREIHRFQREANNAKMAERRETPGAVLFARKHLRRGTKTDVLDHAAVLRSYHTWCRNSPVRAHRVPGRDLLQAVRSEVPGAKFVADPVADRLPRLRPPRGHWIGLRLINPPTDEPATLPQTLNGSAAEVVLSSTMRRLIQTWLLLGASGLAAAGCGGDEARSTPTVTFAPSPTEQATTRADASTSTTSATTTSSPTTSSVLLNSTSSSTTPITTEPLPWPPSQELLDRALLEISDMPTGWAVVPDDGDDADPPCGVSISSIVGVDEIPSGRASYSEDANRGPLVMLSVGVLPRDLGNLDVLGSLKQATLDCRTTKDGFDISYSELSYPPVGDQSFAFRLSATKNGVTLGFDGVEARVGDVVIQVAASDAFGDPTAILDQFVEPQLERAVAVLG